MTNFKLPARFKSIIAVPLAIILSLLSNVSIAQEDNQPPAGFTALFNGKDLTGWHGMGHFSPIKLAEMFEEERKSKAGNRLGERSTALVGRQRRTCERRQGCVSND